MGFMGLWVVAQSSENVALRSTEVFTEFHRVAQRFAEVFVEFWGEVCKEIFSEGLLA
tara:strand:- start:511 stop:681 length:171 start_codon:yes stop_codon:yes gene_type:complete